MTWSDIENDSERIYKRLIHQSDQRNIVRCIQDLDSKFVRYRQIFQSSQWNLKDRILALYIFDEAGDELKMIKDIYKEQCLKIVGMENQSKYGIEEFILAHILREKFDEFSNKDKASVLQGIYIAIEEGDFNEFVTLIESVPIKEWCGSLKEYRGATPLHWAIFYDGNKMLSFIK